MTPSPGPGRPNGDSSHESGRADSQAELVHDRGSRTVATTSQVKSVRDRGSRTVATTMTEPVQLAVTIALTILAVAWAAFFAAIQEAYGRLTPGRAARLVADGRKGAQRVADIVSDPAPTIATARFLCLIGEVTATLGVYQLAGFLGAGARRSVVTGLVVVVVFFVVIAVGAGTIGRQHSSAVALKTGGLMRLLAKGMFFVPQVMIWLGNAVTPGRGYPEGPFASEDELRAYVDLAEASNEIEAGERQMIHSVFDLTDTVVREVMVPRPEVVFIEPGKTLRQALSLALRSGFSRIPVVGPGGLDDIVGIVYLKDISKRIFDHPQAESTESVGTVVTGCSPGGDAPAWDAGAPSRRPVLAPGRPSEPSPPRSRPSSASRPADCRSRRRSSSAPRSAARAASFAPARSMRTWSAGRYRST